MNPARKTGRTAARERRIRPDCETLPTPHVSMRPTRRFASGTAAMGLYFTGFAGPAVTLKYMSRN